MQKGKLFIVSAPSGAGKTTLTNYVIQHLKNKFDLSKIITYTTRQPRQGETPDVDYHFISPAEFARKKAAGQFLETTEYNGNFYGSPRSVIDDLEQGKSFLLVVDRAGAKNLKNLIKEPVLIWLTVPTIQTLENRIKQRGTESSKVRDERLELARQEMQEEEQDPAFMYRVVNKDFEMAAQAIMNIIKTELAQ